MAKRKTGECDVSNYEWHYAKLGLFLSDGDGHVYGLTCKHVTKFPSDGKIYVKTENGCFKPFGTLIPAQYKVEDNSFIEYSDDIDIIEVDRCCHEICCNWDMKMRSAYNDIIVFNEDISMLYNSEISSLCNGSVAFNENADRAKHIFPIKDYQGNSKVLSQPKDPTCITGKIQSKVIHESENQSLSPYSFLLRTYNFKFEKGDSGTIIARVNNDVLELVGVLTGQYESEITKESHILCISLGAGIKLLGEKYQKSFVLYNSCIKSANHGTEYAEFCLLSGTVLWIKSSNIWVKTPEDVQEIDYDFVEVVICLIDAMKDDEMCLQDLIQEEKNEEILSNCVRARENLETREHICDSPAVTCYYLCMKGCNYLYSGNYKKSILELKSATKMIPKLPCRNRMLCRLITYVTWILLKLDKLDKMKAILCEAEEYIGEMTDVKNVCPINSIGFFYFDYARFYIRSGENDKALEKAHVSLAKFRIRGKPNVGMTLAQAMIARLYLKCGEAFESTTIKINSFHLHEAKKMIDTAKETSTREAVEDVTLMLTEVDMLYREGKIKPALKTAIECRRLAILNRLEEEKLRAEVRINELSKR